MTQTALHQFDPTILREYDIRGLVGKTLTEKDAFAIGCAFGTKIRRLNAGNHICVAYDGRESSPLFAEKLIEGLISTGMNVENLGLGPTPMLYFGVKDRKADGGIMITGSHNPAEYNGFKMTLQDSSVFGEAVQEIGRIAAAGDFETGEGSTTKIDIREEYVARLIKDLKSERPLNIVWDNGNGAAGEILQMLVEKLPGNHKLLYEDIDGTFPNHHPDPTVDKNLLDLKRNVLDLDYDLGIAFDGDGDRIGVVDEKGNILRCDSLMTIYAKDVLSRNPGAPIIGDVKCSQVMFDEIARLGGTPIMWNTGHSLVKAKMVEEKAPLAGELSGHIFFKDGYYGFDDALYCSIRLINAVSATDQPFSSLSAHLPTLFNTPEVRIEVEEEGKFDLVPQITKRLKAENDNSIEINDIDGVRVKTNEGWWLLRPSNTQNALVTRVEANSPEALDKLKNMVENELAQIGYNFKFE